MKYLLLAFCFSFSIVSKASHLLGGELQLLHKTGNSYELRLVAFIDANVFDPSLIDPIVSVLIFRNSDNSLVSTVDLSVQGSETIPFSSARCTYGEGTLRVTYSEIVTLEPSSFNDADGYYISWQRCCRNYNLTNIYSEDPNLINANYAGQTWILKFPALEKDGVAMINSSPTFRDPVADYANVGRAFYMDMEASDADGDSLAYSLVTPLSTTTSEARPQPAPEPYPPVTWRPSFSLQNIMAGNPDLSISDRGFLSVTTTLEGLFAFAIKCEEYRDGLKIGEVTREYQILSISGNDPGNAPSISAAPMNGSYSAPELDFLLQSSLSEDEGCFKVKVEDDDVAELMESEAVRIHATTVGFDGSVQEYLPAQLNRTLTPEMPVAEYTICLNACAFYPRENFRIAIVAYDDACAVPLTDTVFVNITIERSSPCQSQVITFPEIPDIDLDEETFDLNATASSGLPVTYTIGNTQRASVLNSTVLLYQPGPVTITAGQGGNNDFQKAPSVTQEFCINPKPPVLTVDGDDSGTYVTSDLGDYTMWMVNDTFLGYASSITMLDTALVYKAWVNQDGCLSAVSQLIITNVEESLSASIQVFPNPTSGKLVIQTKSQSEKFLEIVQTHGKVVYQATFSSANFPVDVSNLPKGIYILRVRDRERIRTVKIVHEGK